MSNILDNQQKIPTELVELIVNQDNYNFAEIKSGDEIFGFGLLEDKATDDFSKVFSGFLGKPNDFLSLKMKDEGIVWSNTMYAIKAKSLLTKCKELSSCVNSRLLFILCQNSHMLYQTYHNRDKNEDKHDKAAALALFFEKEFFDSYDHKLDIADIKAGNYHIINSNDSHIDAGCLISQGGKGDTSEKNQLKFQDANDGFWYNLSVDVGNFPKNETPESRTLAYITASDNLTKNFEDFDNHIICATVEQGGANGGGMKEFTIPQTLTKFGLQRKMASLFGLRL